MSMAFIITCTSPISCSRLIYIISIFREKCFESSVVREYAVSILRSASDDELLTFLLQLVQALRYEPSPMVSAPATAVVDFPLEGSIVGVERLNLKPAAETTGDPVPTALAVPAGAASTAAQRSAGTLSPLASFLIDRACSSPIVANYLYWYLKVEIEDEVAGFMFQAVFDRFIVQLSTADEEGKMLFKRLCALDEYIAKISACQRDAREQRGRKEAKEQALQKLLEERQLSTIPRGVD